MGLRIIYTYSIGQFRLCMFPSSGLSHLEVADVGIEGELAKVHGAAEGDQGKDLIVKPGKGKEFSPAFEKVVRP